MKFYSGFSLRGEEHYFREFVDGGDYCVGGFSYGAIKAFLHVKESLAQKKRVDTLQLFSPAFFQTKEDRFKRLQLMGYAKDKDGYLRGFIKSCFSPYEKKIVSHVQTQKEELEELLYYEWNMNELKEIVNAGVKIEVYLGGRDAVIDAEGAREFFLHVATVTYIKDANHFLLTN